MATVTGYTAERMQEIEDGSIVDGNVVGGDLILQRRDGATINAGSVAGPAGPEGPPGPTSIQIVTSTTRPTGVDRFEGLMIWETDTNLSWMWDGVSWVWRGGTFVCTSTTRPAAPVAGMEIFETDTLRRYVYTGAAWSYRDGGTDPTYAWAYRTAPLTLAAGAWTTVPLDSEAFDYGSRVAGGVYLTPEARLYRVDVRIAVTFATTSHRFTVGFNYGAQGIAGEEKVFKNVVAGETSALLLSATIPMNAGVNVQPKIYNSGATPVAMVVGNADDGCLRIHAA